MPTYPDSLDASPPECMPHGYRWRSRFQCMLNQLRANKDFSKLNKPDIDKIPFAVCTCLQSNRDYTVKLEPDKRWEEIPDEEYKAAERYFDQYVESLDKTSEYYSLLKYHFSALQKHEELQNKSSSQRFLLLFQRNHQSDDKELLNRPTKRTEGDKEEAKRIKQTVHLPSLNKDYIPLFCGRNGRNLRRYLQGKKKVKVQLETKDDQVYATIVCKAQDREKIVERLTKEAELLAERRKIHDENQREYLQRMELDANSQEEEDMDS
ncbi:uncharacterized protein LOC125673190 [Ostrea edulis]|uniref:uncharacterized protein LOC125673190 n=1 Tax=Ostrea edulis TaxID=37623 RepID=UPI0024AED08C|nr:uncharacterized protein LOC125673190 [Ostrea edulis]